MQLRTLVQESARRPPRHCDYVGLGTGGVACNKATREGKLYCADHVEHHPYAQEVVALRERREHEAELVRLETVERAARAKRDVPAVAAAAKARRELVRRTGIRAVTADSLLAQDLLQQLGERGEQTEERLARYLVLDVEIVRALVGRLRRAGTVRTRGLSRGATAVRATRAVGLLEVLAGERSVSA